MPDDLLTVLKQLYDWVNTNMKPQAMSDTQTSTFRDGWWDAMVEVKYRLREEIVKQKGLR